MNPKALRHLLFRMYGMPAAILALLSVALVWQNHVLARTVRQVNRSDQVTSEARRLLRQLAEMDSAVRGYLLTGRSEVLVSFEKNGKETEGTFNSLSDLLRGDRDLEARVEAMRAEAADWKRYADSLVAVKRSGGDYASYERLVESNRLMDRFRDEREKLLSAELSRRERYARDLQFVARLTDLSTVLLSLVAFTVLALVTSRQFKELTLSFSKLLSESESRAGKLHESHSSMSRQAELLDLAYEPILVRDTEDRIVYWNRGAERTYGWSKDEALGRISHELLKTNFPAPLQNIMTELHTTGSWTGELTHTTRAGGVLSIESRWVLQKDEAGLPIGILETNFDVTDRKKKEEQLQRLSAIVESSYDAIIGKTVDGTITSWNAGATMLYGYAPEEMIGNSIALLIPKDHPDEEASIMQRILRGEVIDQYETVRMCRDGSMVEVSLRVSPIYDSDGNIVGASNIARDITQRKQTERALMQTEKLASVGRMAATMAHEINNPLAAAINSVYLVSMDPSLPEKSRRALATAEQELARVAHLTKQTLGFYRESSKPSAVRLAEVLEGVLNLYRPRLANKNIKVVRRFESDLEVFVVEGELRQVVSNLIANSIDAVGQNGVIYVRSTPMSVDGGRPMVRLTIADKGEGISMEHLPHLFEPFFTTKQTFGTGLGLWVSKELVQKQDGRIRVRSRKGKGTVVTVWLPAERRVQQYIQIA